MNKIALVLFAISAAFCRASMPGFITVGSTYQFYLSSSPGPFLARINKIDPSGWIETIGTDGHQTLWLNVSALQAVLVVNQVSQASAAPEADQARTLVQAKARPRLVAPGAKSTTNVGILGMDARWSEYGDYMSEMLEIVRVQWYRILAEMSVSPPHGSHVTITFRLNSKGETEIVKVEDADAGKQGVFSCQNAITARQPYRKWSAQMISALGDDQQITLSFYYQ